MKFCKYSIEADRAVTKFERIALNDNELSVLLQRASLCHYEIILITRDNPIAERLSEAGPLAQKIEDLFDVWKTIFSYPENDSIQKRCWQVIRKVGENLHSRHQLLWRFNDKLYKNTFFLFLCGNEITGLPTNIIFFCSNLWQMEQNYLPLHASGIIQGDDLFLFTGVSGAGKSTIANLGQGIGKFVLDEDQVLIHLSAQGLYTADAWGYNITHSNACLRAIFTLVQSKEDCLKPLKRIEMVKILLARHSDIMGGMLCNNLLRQSFKLIASIVRYIPGYELHFRKSPDFWKLIDEQFPG